MRKKTEMPVVEVEWLDAHSELTDTSTAAALKNKPVATRSIGYLLAENDEGITLVSDRWPGEPNRGFISNFIGWGMVRGYWEIVYDK